MLNFLHIGRWSRGQVHLAWVAGARSVVGDVERGIEEAWGEAMKRAHRPFDGGMCRMESSHVAGDGSLQLTLSRTSYRLFFGTNLRCARELAGRYGREVMANPVGLSVGLVSADGFVLMGRRNVAVAYYPERIHPFAGSLEPREPVERVDVFEDAMRELAEEVGLRGEDVDEMHCAGIVEDQTLLQPEMIFLARCRRGRAEIEGQLDRAEHREVWAVEARVEAVERALVEERAEMTPVGVGTLLLWGRDSAGEEWFGREAARVAARV